MSGYVQIAFNLLLNSLFSFWAGCFIVWLCLWIFKVENSRWKLFLLSLPFAKIIWDLAVRKITPTSIVHAQLNPWDLPPKHQTLSVSAGFSEYGPLMSVEFTSNTAAGKHYSTSIPDYVYYWLVKHIGPGTPEILLGAVLAISFFLVARRWLAAMHFERKRKRQRGFDTSLEKLTLPLREVDVYQSEEYSGTPFTGGILKPYICFPAKTYDLLNTVEREAVVQHELAHISHLDLVGTLAVKSLGDLLWFIPGYRFLCRQIDSLRELLADKNAISCGASGPHLASALIKLKGIPEDNQQAVLFSAFFREKSLLKRRVANLVKGEGASGSRLGWQNRWLRLVILFWTTSAVMVATFGGNHEAVEHIVPQWADKIFRGLGWM
jgi:hypothetical protein